MAEVTADTLVIQSRLDAVAGVRHWAAQRVRAARFDDEAVFAVELALSEALANVIKHAYGGREDQEIRLLLVVDDEKLSLTIRDFGEKFDMANYAAPDLDAPSAGGYGVFLMHQLMDEVTYDTSPEKGTRLTLVRYRSRREVEG